MDGTGVVSGVSVSHERASVDDIEAAAAESQRRGVEALRARDGVEEAFVLQTCNRAEAYVVSDAPAAGRAALDDYVADVPDAVTVELDHEESLRHLLRVAAGLESVVLGEDQILGQVRDAYEDARGVGGIGPMLERGVTKAMRVGERARTETGINEGIVSLGSAAVTLAREEADLADATALVVGAGEMGSLVAKALDGVAGRVLVANRTVSHAEHVVAGLDCEASAVGLDAVPTAVDRADLVISATGSPDPVVPATAFREAGETLVVDLAQPRDVPPAAGDLAGVTVHDLDALESVTEESRARRAEAAAAVEDLVDEEFERLLTQYKRTRADRVIASMYESAEQVKTAEVNTALQRLDLDEEEREVVESMADALVGQLLAAPTRSLRDAAENDDWATIDTALRLFDPDFGGDDAGFAVDDLPEGVRAAALDRSED
ncbi:MAG: glutamyl-tRNA reductase [Halorientalis sp.]